MEIKLELMGVYQDWIEIRVNGQLVEMKLGDKWTFDGQSKTVHAATEEVE